MGAEMQPGFRARLHPHRFTVLLIILVANILLEPALSQIRILEEPIYRSAIRLVLFSALLVSAVYVTSQKRSIRYLTVALAFGALVAATVDYSTDHTTGLFLHHLLDLLFLAMVTSLILAHVFRERRVTLNLINATLCAYLILGLAWAAGYGLIEVLDPSSFQLPEDGFGGFIDSGNDEVARRVYFSFVTLLTLGYGDIFPLGTAARLAAVMEAFLGQVIMVVLVARLVGVHVAQTFESDKESDE